MANITNGTVTVQVTGGVGPYQYTLLNAGSNTPVPSNAYPTFTNPKNSITADTFTFGNANDITGNSGLQAGSYIVKIVDSNLCETLSSVLVVSNATPAPTATPVPMPTATPVPDPTATDVPDPTATPVPEPTATEVPDPTATDVPDPTATPVPDPTATDVPDPTATPEPEPTSGYAFHLGNGGYPYAQDLINEGPLYKSDNSIANDFADLFTDMQSNPGSYESVVTIPSLMNGIQIEYAQSSAQNYYWLLLPESMGIPDLTQEAKLADTQNMTPDVAGDKLITVIDGVPAVLYRINLQPSTEPVTIQYIDQ